jgi:predicted restriction endonuclease
LTYHNACGNVYVSDKNKNMKQTKHDSINELEEFVTQQAHDDADLPSSEKRHQTQVVIDVLSDEVVNPKTLKKLIDEYIADCAKYRSQSAKRNHAVLTT